MAKPTIPPRPILSRPFDRINAAHIFVFPNNGNIILAAKQAASIYEKAEIHVMESKDFGAGYAAILSFDSEAACAEELENVMREAMQSVTTGYISPAVRDADLNGVHITDGEYIGYIGKEILVSDKDRTDAAMDLTKTLLSDEKYLLTLFYGKEVEEDEVAALEARLAEAYPELEVYAVSGGQDIHPYIIVAE